IGRLQDAKADLLKSIQIESKLSSAYWHIHFIFLLEGKIKEALYHLEQCMKCTSMIEPIQNFTTTTSNINSTTTTTKTAAAMVRSTTTTTRTAAATAMTTTTTDNRNNNSNMKSFNTNLHQFYHDILNSKAFIYSLLNDSKMEIEIWTKLIHYNPTYELAYEKRANLYLKALYIRGCLLTKTCPLQSLRDLTLCIYVGNQKYQTMAFIQRGLMFNQLKRAIQAYTNGINKETIPDIKLLLCRAEAYYQSNQKYKEAETILLEDTTKHQLVLSNILLLGLIMDKQQKTMNSIELLVNSLKKLNCKKLEKIEIYNHLGQYYMKIGDYIPAIEAFTSFIHYDPHRPHVYLYRAQSTCQLIAIHLHKRTILPNDFNDNVLNDISQALVLIHSKTSSVDQIHLNGPMKYVDLIDQCLLTRIIYFGINQRYTKAILNSDLNIAIEKDQKSSLAYYNRGLCRQTQDKWNDAIEDYDQAIKSGTLNGSVQLYSLINRSIIYIEKCQDYHKAIKDLYQAKTIMDKLMNSTIQTETNSDLFIKLILEMYPEAEQILHNLTIQQPNFLKGYIAYANCLMDYEGYKIKMNETNSINLWNQALNEYEFALKLDKYNLEASIGLSMCLQKNNHNYHNSNDNNNHHNSARKSRSHLLFVITDAYDCRGIIYLQLGRFQYAIDDLTNAIRLNRYSTKYLINRGVAYFCNHQLMPAMIDFKYANQLDSTNNLAYYHQALIYLHHGQFGQAENRINLIINKKQSPSIIINQLQSICLDPSLWLLRSIIKLMKYKSNDYSDSILNEALNDACYAEQLIVPKLMNELT
ncbi:uncharacterized protein DC041_0011091, partial [Schistosoma bovis]